MKKKFKKNTFSCEMFTFAMGIVYILIGVYLYHGHEDQSVFIVAGIALMLISILFLLDRLI